MHRQLGLQYHAERCSIVMIESSFPSGTGEVVLLTGTHGGACTACGPRRYLHFAICRALLVRRVILETIETVHNNSQACNGGSVHWLAAGSHKVSLPREVPVSADSSNVSLVNFLQVGEPQTLKAPCCEHLDSCCTPLRVAQLTGAQLTPPFMDGDHRIKPCHESS